MKSRSIWRLPIRLVLFIGFLVACGAPILGFWAWSYDAIIDHKKLEVRERHLLLAKNLGYALRRYHDDLLSAFDAFAAPVAAGGDAGFAHNLFRKLHFRHVCVFRLEDLTLKSSFLTEKDPCPNVLPEVRAEFFLDLVEGQNSGSVMSSVNHAPGGEPVIFLVKRLGSDIVIGAITTVYFQQLGGRISFGRQGHAAIVDQTGHVLAHPLPSWEADARDISKVSAVQRMMRGESGVEIFYSPALKGDMIAGFTTVTPPGWGVMVPQPITELEEAAEEVLQAALLILFLGIGFAGVLALVLAERFGKSISLVSDAAERMADGDINARVETRRSGLLFSELADLGGKFNHMADEMQQARTLEISLRMRAEQAAVAKSRFLATMSHEIRTPMNGVLGLGAVLRTTDLNEQQQLYVDRIMDSGGALMGVLNDILDYSQVEAGQLPICAVPLDLGQLAESVVNLMSAEPERRGVALDLKVDPSIGTIVGDEQRTRQILLNLLGNAVKFTDTGRIDVTVKPADDAAMVRISVKDTGIGIPDEFQPAIFTDFMQVDQSLNRPQGGSGLGLAICKRLAKALGGDIGFTSKEGAGAEFWYTLPVKGVPSGQSAKG